MKQKTSLKRVQKIGQSNNVTVIFGYGLFLLTILGLLLWTIIPLENALTFPTARYFNIIVLMISFVAAAILPAVGSYILGDRATHIKNRLRHHYNGVLFGIAAYWAASVLSFLGYSLLADKSELPIPFSTLFATGVPIILTIALMALLAIQYAKKQKNKSSVIEYRPYQIILVGSIVALYTTITLNSSFNTTDGLWTSILAFAFPILLTFISYKVLIKYHTSRLASFTDAIIAMSFGYITLSSIISYISFLNLHWSVTLVWSYVIALVVWVTYLYLRTRKPA